MEQYYLYTFSSTHAAIQTEKLLASAGARIMPVPRFISASCGIAIRIRPENSKLADQIMLGEGKLTLDQYAYYHISPNSETGEIDCIQIR